MLLVAAGKATLRDAAEVADQLACLPTLRGNIVVDDRDAGLGERPQHPTNMHGAARHTLSLGSSCMGRLTACLGTGEKVRGHATASSIADAVQCDSGFVCVCVRLWQVRSSRKPS